MSGMQPVRSEPGITWGVKTSFREYVSRLPDGDILLEGGASEHAEGTFFFPFAAIERNETHTELRILGSGRITFSGHGGMMAVPIAQPTVLLAPGGAGVCVEQDNGTTFQLAVLQLGALQQFDHHAGWSEAPAQLTAAGAAYFGGLYPEGTELAPITIVLPTARPEKRS